jgi:hypothetical protein
MELLSNYKPNSEENTMRLLNEIDPYNNKQITFSEIVSLFANVKLIFNKYLVNIE